MTEVKVYDALENTSDADDVMIAKTALTYDDYAATGGMEGYTGAPKPPGHDSAIYPTSFIYRGNVTGTTQWIDIVANTTLPTRLKKYDVYGNVLQEQLSCCKQKVFTYVQDDYWTNPPTVTNGDPQGLHLTGSTTYDFNTGLPKYTEFAGMGKRWFFYDAALRLIRKELPSGGIETATYDDGAMTASLTKSGLGTSTVTNDGFGRVTQAVDPNNAQVNTSFDSMGRIASRTNPFTAGGTPGPATTIQYDALGRGTITTLPDGNTIQNQYSGSAVTSIDQVNRKIKRETDGLGRLTKVIEQDSSGVLAQETNYSYSLMDKLTLVNQGNQTRAFRYDALGRMLYERIPEQSATINDGTGTMWSCKYTYTDFSAVATKTDARGVVFTYDYDSMNRLRNVIPNVSNAPGVAPGGGGVFNYDLNNSSPTRGLLLSTGNESYTYDTWNRLGSITRSIDGVNYTTSYQYGAGDVRSRITYPTGRVLNLNRDSTGRLSSLTDGVGANYLSGMGYNAAGQVTGLTLGNGVAETYGYDANRLQLTTQTATKSGGAQNGLINLTYGYQASAGQMGAGTTTGNAGQLMSISGTINSMTESAAYTYDNLGRLVTSNQTSNGSSAQRRFGYDRWANRTGVWDAVSGGAQIQSIALQQSGGAPTNRIASVTSGSTLNYVYDAAGNVTSDGVHTYQYDSENRVVSVDGGTTAQYDYDQNNRRIKKTIGSAVTHYVWEGSQVVSEHDGSGALLVDYVYSGSRMIGKIASGSTQYFLGDRLSTRMTLDSSGNVLGRQAHLPFGEDFGESGTQDNHHFTSYERDTETSQDYAINRGYAVGVGRFVSSDPYRASGYLIDPQSWNRYSYTRNDPANRIDPIGLQDTYVHIPGWDYMNINGSNGMKVDGSGGFGGRYQPFLDTGPQPGAGGGSGAGKPSTKTRVKQFFKTVQGKSCAKFLNDPSHPLRPSANLVEHVAAYAGWIDVTAPGLNTKTFAELGIDPSGVSGANPNDKLSTWLGPGLAPNGQRYNAFTNLQSESWEAFIGGNYASSTPGQQALIAVHESLHMATHFDDAGLAALLGINVSKGASASEAITSFLAAGCPEGYTYPTKGK